MSIIDAVLLGFVQGFTEFLPISSSGHLVLARSLFDINIDFALAFDGILHLATVLAVSVYFFPDIWSIVQTALRKLGRLPVNARDEVLLYALLLGTIPAVVLGLFAESFIESAFNSPLIVAGMLFLAACFFMFAEWRYSFEPRDGIVSPLSGFKIGLFQALALLPGFSRSGATIGGGMILGLTRLEATRFSFLLAIPVTLGVGLKKMVEFIISDERVLWLPVFFGAATAAITAFIVIHFFLGFVRKYSLWPFVWYTLILSFFVLFVFWFG